MSIPTSDVLRDYEIAGEIATQEAIYRQVAPRPSVLGLESLWTWIAGNAYGNEAYIASERERIFADLRGEPAGSWISQVTQRAETELGSFTAGVTGPAGAAAEAAGEAVSGAGEAIGGGLRTALGGARGILTLVVIGVVGLAVFAVAR